jgi:glyoxylase-like metal-dependent hydrolase (beta-lactamase superfamily II)
LADLLAPGLWWLHGTRGSNVYLVEADDGQLALVDTGFASSAGAILAGIHAHGGRLSAILLTHRHRDHSGAAAAVRSATGARLYIGRGDCLVRDGQAFLHTTVGRTHVARFLAGRMDRSHRADVPVDFPIDHETEVLPGIRAVPVPGHTPGSCCFVVDRLGAAFVGDLVISHGGELTRSMRLANHDDQQYLDSIRQFAAVAPELGLPGHGQPVMGGFGAALRELAALPRRPLSPKTFAERTFRMTRFGRDISRKRLPGAPHHPGQQPPGA